MAKSQNTDGGPKAPVQFDTIPTEKASQELTALRTGRRGRTSQFEPLFEALGGLQKGQSIRLQLTKSQYLNLGQQLRKRFGKDIKASTAASKEDPEMRVVYISRGTDV